MPLDPHKCTAREAQRSTAGQNRATLLAVSWPGTENRARDLTHVTRHLTYVTWLLTLDPCYAALDPCYVVAAAPAVHQKLVVVAALEEVHQVLAAVRAAVLAAVDQPLAVRRCEQRC